MLIFHIKFIYLFHYINKNKLERKREERNKINFLDIENKFTIFTRDEKFV